MTDWTALERIAQDSLRRGLTQMALHPSNFLALLAELREAQAKARDIGIAATYEENRLKATPRRPALQHPWRETPGRYRG